MKKINSNISLFSVLVVISILLYILQLQNPFNDNRSMIIK